MSFNQDKIRERENELAERLMLLATLYEEYQIDKNTILMLGEIALSNAHKKIINQVSQKAGEMRLSPPDEDTAHKELNRAKADFRDEVNELRTDPETAKVRIQQTAQYTTWTSFNQAILNVANKAEIRQVFYRTAMDERVCPTCLEAEGTYLVNEAPIPPIHVNCRCFIELT